MIDKYLSVETSNIDSAKINLFKNLQFLSYMTPVIKLLKIHLDLYRATPEAEFNRDQLRVPSISTVISVQDLQQS